MIQTAAKGIRLNVLALRLLRLLVMVLLLLLLTVACYVLLLLLMRLLMGLLLLLGKEQLRISALSGTWRWRWLGRDLRQVVMVLHVGVWQDSTAGETIRYVRKQPMMFHCGVWWWLTEGFPY